MPEPVFPVISAVVTFHSEGLLAHKTLLGLERLRCHTEAQGIAVELVVVLDCADMETARVVKSSPVLRVGDQVLEVSNRDLGASRNSGVGIARGNYIGIFDGDDYYAKNWLLQALAVVESKQGEVVVHPEYIINFGAMQGFSSPWDMDDQTDFSLANCLAQHTWVACSFGRKDLYLRYPYHRTDFAKTGFGYEDWHWNLELVSHGVRHVTAKKTALFYRRKPASMFTVMHAAGVVIRPTEFFNHPDRWDKPDATTQVTAELPELDDKTYIAQLLKGKEWLESHLKAVEAAKDVQVAWLESQLVAHQSQMREQSERLGRLQRALPVRVLKLIGVISNV